MMTVFVQVKFWLLVAFSLVIPFVIYGILLTKPAISRFSLLLLGFALVVIAGIDVYLLQSLATLAKLTPSLADDAVFASEVSLGLYVLPVLYAGVGVNIISHVLVRHLEQAEKSFDDKHPDYSGPLRQDNNRSRLRGYREAARVGPIELPTMSRRQG